VERQSGGQSLVGTAGKGAFLNHVHLATAPSLSDAHVTSLALFHDTLWVGTFNGGLMTSTPSGEFVAQKAGEPGQMINALVATSTSLFVGTSNGLFRSMDGLTFESVDFVEGAVVGLAYDETSLWASTTGALYRIKCEGGPPSDVWWMPGGSRSLQKISAIPGAVWLATEDRGSVLMRANARTVSADRPFSIFDRSRGLASSWSLSTAALDKGGALMSTLREGLIHIKEDGSFEQMPTTVSPWGLATMAEGDDVWFGSQGGAERLSLSTGQRSKILGLPDPRVHAFLRDNRRGKEEHVWIGTEGGLARVRAPLTSKDSPL
jgi:ligand-binding sensor domain-containing protein